MSILLEWRVLKPSQSVEELSAQHVDDFCRFRLRDDAHLIPLHRSSEPQLTQERFRILTQGRENIMRSLSRKLDRAHTMFLSPQCRFQRLVQISRAEQFESVGDFDALEQRVRHHAAPIA